MIDNIVILGDGQLGTCIRDLTDWDYISRKKDNIDANDFDFSKILNGNYEYVLNCIGFTDTYSDDRESNWNINYKFVSELADFCHKNNISLIHISTDYVYTNSVSNASEEDVPVHCRNWYGYTKLLGDAYIQLKMNDYLIIRCSFKPNPFPYKKALVNQIGNFDYIDVISELIVDLIEENVVGVYNIGTDVKTIYELAKESKYDVKPMFEKIHESMPEDITMNCSKMIGVFS